MTLKTLHRVAAMMTLIAAAALAPVSAASAKPRTIKLKVESYLVEPGLEEKVLDKLFTASGKIAGTETSICNTAQYPTESCTDTYKLKGGTIVAQTSGTGNALLTATISSGTGSFTGAQGTVTTKTTHQTVGHAIVSHSSVTIKLR